MGGLHLGGQLGHAGRVGDIGDMRRGVGVDQRGGLVQSVLVDVHQRHRTTPLGQGQADGPADPAACSSDHGYSTVKILHLLILSQRRVGGSVADPQKSE